MKTNRKELENAINWLFSAKSPMVKTSNPAFQQHVVSNVTSIKRIASMFNISNAEALVITYQGLSNGHVKITSSTVQQPTTKRKYIKKKKDSRAYTRTTEYRKMISKRMKAAWARKKAVKETTQPISAESSVEVVNPVDSIDTSEVNS